MKLIDYELLFMIERGDWDGLAAAIARHHGCSLQAKAEVALLDSVVDDSYVSLRICDKCYTWSRDIGFYSYRYSAWLGDAVPKLTVIRRRDYQYEDQQD